jgi:hypothetical protein
VLQLLLHRKKLTKPFYGQILLINWVRAKLNFFRIVMVCCG